MEGTRKTTTNKVQSEQKKGNKNIRADINEMESIQQHKRSMKPRNDSLI